MFHGRPDYARIAAVAVAGASCLAAAACGGGAASSLSAAPGASSTQDPLASLTGNQVATQALTNLKAASSLTMAGKASDSGQSVTVDLRLKPGQGCAGTIKQGTSGVIKLVVIDKIIYFNPDEKFWETQLGAEASTVTGIVNGRYIKTRLDAKGMSTFASLCDVSHTVASEALSKKGNIDKEPVTTVNGVRVLPLKAADGTVYVTDASKPEIVEVDAPKTASAAESKLAFVVGAPVTLTAPPASQVLDGASIGM
jgi:hypothetical protein